MSTSTSTSGQKVLTEEQRSLLEQWLLDDSPALTYEQAQARMLREFGLRVSYGSIAKFYQRRTQERMARKLADSAAATAPICERFSEPSPKIFETLLELGGLAAIEARLQAERPSMNQISQIVQLAALGLRARNQASHLRLRERAQAFREKMYQDSLPVDDPPAESPSAPPPPTNPALSAPPPPAPSNDSNPETNARPVAPESCPESTVTRT